MVFVFENLKTDDCYIGYLSIFLSTFNIELEDLECETCDWRMVDWLQRDE